MSDLLSTGPAILSQTKTERVLEEFLKHQNTSNLTKERINIVTHSELINCVFLY